MEDKLEITDKKNGEFKKKIVKNKNLFIKWWKNLRTLQKVSFILFVSMLVTMFVGLIVIGSYYNGFYLLKIYGVSAVLNAHYLPGLFPHPLVLVNGGLKFGVVLAAVFTPLLLSGFIITFATDFYKNYINKNQK